MKETTKSRILEIAEERMHLLESLYSDPRGLPWCEDHSDLADEVVRLLFRDAADEVPGDTLAIVATGGYGRRELAPWSDIDITVVPDEEASAALDAPIRNLFRDLHWACSTALGLQVGYSYRLISDAAGLDDKTRTGLIDMRLIAGSTRIFGELDDALVESFWAGEFILAKIREREENFAKYNDTPLVVEPHLKEGAGGVRSFQCANWIRDAIGERPAQPTDAYRRVMLIRNLLHLVSGRSNDLLTRQRQAEIADILQVDVYEMMSQLAQAGLALHSWYRRSTERLKESRFSLTRGVLAARGEVRLLQDADAGEAAVGVALATQMGLEISDLPLIASSKSVRGPAAVYAMTTGEKTLRNLDRSGLLKQILPELDRCKTLMPDDNIHVYTVFEHTLRAVANLDKADEHPFLGNVKGMLTDLEPLYLAMLLHDVGKAVPGKPHSESGGEIAREVCQRWGLASSITDAVSWLVREHLTMSRVMSFRDIADPRTITEFGERIGDSNRLALLTLLTWADTKAVAPTALTPSQEAFLKELCERTLAYFEGDSPPQDIAVQRKRLIRQLQSTEADENELRSFIESLPAHYLTGTPTELIQIHMQMATQAEDGEPTVEHFRRPDLGASDVTVVALDSPGLLSRLLGVFYALDLSVIAIRASTTGTTPAVALDVFTLSFAGRPLPTATANQLTRTLLDVLNGQKTVEQVLREHGKDPDSKQHTFTHTYHDGLPGILEIRSSRGRGMPYRFSRWISEQGWNILSARVGQWAGSAAASFYLLGKDGVQLSREEVDRVLLAGKEPEVARL